MAWPHQPAPAAQPAPSGGSAQLSLGALIAAASGALTFLFSFVQVLKVDESRIDVGWSVWTLSPFGFFGIGTFIPIFALAAGALALIAMLGQKSGLADKRFADFSLLQLQLVCTAFAALLTLGYLVNSLVGGGEPFDVGPGLGILLLLIGSIGLVAGAVLTILEGKRATAAGGYGFGQTEGFAPGQPQQWGQQPGAPAEQQWQQPAAQSQQWQQPAAPADQQWQQPAAQPQHWQQPAAPAAPPDQPWQQPAAQPQQWPQPAAPAAPAEPQWQQPPAPQPGPAEPPPAGPGQGALVDSGTQMIPGPPPAPPDDEGPPQPQGPPAGAPEPPPSNT